MAVTPPAAIGLGTAPGTVGAVTADATDTRNVMLGDNFRSLPQFLPIIPPAPPLPGAIPGAAPAAGPLINANQFLQSQFNTLVHELSHVCLSTQDVLGAGGTAYGTQRAAALAVANPAQAQNNAENVGIFVEACGHHEIS